MSFLGKLGNSKYLKKEDADPTPLLLTIKDAQEEDVSMEGEAEKIKTVLYFEEVSKGFVLGPTTGGQIASFLGDPGESPESWFGQKIVLYNDKTVMMKGKVVGGLRVRQPRNSPPLAPLQKPAPSQSRPASSRTVQPPPEEPAEDDVPF